MANIVDTTVTGAGNLSGFSPALAALLLVHITNVGNAWALDGGGVNRYLHLGWYAFYWDTAVSAEPPADTAQYKYQYRFLDFVDTLDIQGSFTFPFGPDGLIYNLEPGVEAHIVVNS
jgi:hypothetical protein